MEEKEPNSKYGEEQRIDHSFTISTDVDELVKLVDQVKEISLSDAASKLNVPVRTLEAWANYLEEEGALSIKYKLTTPYLVSSIAGEKTGEKLPKKQELRYEYTPRTKFSEDEHKDKVVEVDESTEDFQIPDVFPEFTHRVNQLLEKAYEDIGKGRYEQAQRIYEEIKKYHEKLPTGLNNVKKDFDIKLTKLNRDLSVNIKGAHKKEVDRLTREIQHKLKEIDSAVSKHDINRAEEIYGEVEQLYNNFPESYAVNKALIKTHILDVYEKLTSQKK
ncbi:hypothetical protein KY320_03965, partial [Candidatus Woesearchaeota archaeon]|nr:hypothetical protein [Candidatus Woesearchaeota archaeon]